MDMTKIQQLLERIAGLLRTESRNLLSAHGLQPVQFEALVYLSNCNRYSDTLMGVTEYLGQTKGTVSQTLRVLEKKELIKKVPDQTDKRVTHMSLTVTGRKLVNDIQSSALLKSANEHVDRKGAASLQGSLQALLEGMQQANDFKTFGQCATCKHNTRYSSGETICGLTKETLSNKDVELICREHEPSNRV